MSNSNKTNYIPSQKGLISARRSLLEAIRLQTGVSLKSESTKYFSLVDKWIKSNGKRAAVLRLKQVHHAVLNFMLNQPSPEYAFMRTYKGFPSCVKSMRKHRKSPEGIQAVLGLLAYYRGIVAPGIPDFTPITESGPDVPEELMKDIVELKDIERWSFRINDLAIPNHLYKVKKGPNGLATHSALLDLHALKQSENLLKGIRYFDDVQNGGQKKEDIPEEVLSFYRENPDFPMPSFGPDKELSESIDILLPELTISKECKHSRLAVKREGGGKDRVFAIADYWTQCALDPLHQRLSKILRTIPQDCTFDQSKGVEAIKSWTMTSNEIHSLDLSSATDRFPRSLQSKVLEKLTGSKEYGQRWSDLMSNREFHYKGKTYKWSVGQPLGALSSWPMFAVTHHVVVRYCAQKLGVNPEYYILGDDIVINGDSLAESYKKLIHLLGVRISASKSVRGNSAEFAKRLFYQGTEVSAAPVQMLQALNRDSSLIKSTCQHLVQRSCHKVGVTLVNQFVRQVSEINRVSYDKLSILARSPVPLTGSMIDPIMYGSPLNRELDTPWGQINCLTPSQVQIIYLSEALKELKSQVRNMQKETDKQVRIFERMEIQGLTPDTTMKDYTPIGRALVNRGSQLMKAFQRLIDLEDELKFFPESAVEILVPQINVLSLEFPSSSKRAVKLEGLIISKTFEVCKDFNSRAEDGTLKFTTDQEFYCLVRDNETRLESL
jgi:hypothetical protein